eukprot:TRINITY_DN5883_c0_g1_i1.p1 TRINITY_DN5883_c0_g1~~TRINITY_DN5883_c0_g1_i1.p1  ORF type:complete len:237 (+),score=20.50 TRINITY_DN5883_c0_g1_i1:110-820(+)
MSANIDRRCEDTVRAFTASIFQRVQVIITQEFYEVARELHRKLSKSVTSINKDLGVILEKTLQQLDGNWQQCENYLIGNVFNTPPEVIFTKQQEEQSIMDMIEAEVEENDDLTIKELNVQISQLRDQIHKEKYLQAEKRFVVSELNKEIIEHSDMNQIYEVQQQTCQFQKCRQEIQQLEQDAGSVLEEVERKLNTIKEQGNGSCQQHYHEIRKNTSYLDARQQNYLLEQCMQLMDS